MSENKKSDAVKLVSGRLSDDELAAIAVAVATMSAVSRAEAHERELLAKVGGAGSAWNAAQNQVRSGHTLRTQANSDAWKFSHR